MKKKLPLYAAICFLSYAAGAQNNVGIGTNSPASKATISGNLAVGAAYGSIAAPANGAIVQGQVGIGTSDPSAKLTVQLANDADNGFRVTDNTTSSNIVVQPLAGANSGFQAINFNGYYSGTEQRFNTLKNRWRIVVDQRGAADQLTIDAYNGTSVTTGLTISTAGNIQIPSGTLDMNSHRINNVTDPSLAQDAATKNYVDVKVNTSVTGTPNTLAKFTGTNTLGNSMLFDNGTVVSIGTTTPTALLSVVSNKAGTSSNWYDPGNYAGYVLHNTNNTQRYGLLVSDFWRAPENYVFAVDGRFFVDGTVANDQHNPYLTVRGDGNVGIGTAAPGQKLTVAGTIESTSGGYKFPDATTQTSAAAWRKVAETTSGSAATSLTVSGLDLDAAKVLQVFLVTRNTNAGSEICMYFNGDMTDGNYASMHGHIYSSGLGQALRPYPEIGATSTNGTMFAEIKIMRGGDGHPRFLVHETEMQVSSDGQHLFGGRWKSNSNVTSITFKHNTANGLDAGTKIIVVGLF